MPVGRSENIVAAIHQIDFQVSSAALKTDADTIDLHLSKKSKSAISNIADPDIIGCVSLEGTVGAAGYQVVEKIPKVLFKIPVLVANNKLYFGGVVDNTGGCTAYIRIHYTLRRVSRAELYDALVD